MSTSDVLRSVHVAYELEYTFLGNILNVSQTCKEAAKYNFQINWKRILISHFPSYYLLHESLFVKNTVWREEYIKAYTNLALRYMCRGNLNRTKVIHLGPTALAKWKVRGEAEDKDQDKFKLANEEEVKDKFPCDRMGVRPKILMTPREEYPADLPQFCKDNRLDCYSGNIFENKAYMVSEDWQSVAAFDLNTYDIIPAHAPIAQYKADQYFSASLVMAGDLLYGMKDYTRLICYDTKSGRKVWENEARTGNSDMVVFENKVILVSAMSLYCFDALTGSLLFSHISDDEPDGDEECHLAIDGEHAIWNAMSHLIVYNLRNRQLTETMDLSYILCNPSYLVVKDGICVMEEYTSNKRNVTRLNIIAIKLSYAVIPTQDIETLEIRKGTKRTAEGEIKLPEYSASDEEEKGKHDKDSSDKEKSEDEESSDEEEGEDEQDKEKKAKLKIMWKFKKIVFEDGINSTLCVYGDQVYVYVRELDDDGQIISLNLYTGKTYWTVGTGTSGMAGTGWAGVREFCIVEGSATLAERKQLIAQRNEGMESHDGDRREEDAEDEEELDLADAYFPTLHFHTYDEESHCGALNAYTGDETYADDSRHGYAYSSKNVAISKQNRLMLSLSK